MVAGKGRALKVNILCHPVTTLLLPRYKTLAMILALSNMDSQQIFLKLTIKDYYLISLRQFITCGKLGKISFCMTENQVKRVIGDPDSVHKNKIFNLPINIS